jgi:hypothetical protein
MEILNNNDFDFLSGRIIRIDIANDILRNFEFSRYLSEFEKHIYGVFLQLGRIHKDLDFKSPLQPRTNKYSITSASLDIYFYILTWDKIKKIFEIIKTNINEISLTSKAINPDFTSSYRLLRKRFEKLFSEFDTAIRNEFEHPSLNAHLSGSFIMYGNITMDRSGNIKAHAGDNHYAIIKQDHYLKLNELRIELFDLLIYNFSTKPLNKELLKLKQYLADNIDNLLIELKKYSQEKRKDDFEDLFKQLIWAEMSLSSEGIDLQDEIRRKIYSMPFSQNNNT